MIRCIINQLIIVHHRTCCCNNTTDPVSKYLWVSFWSFRPLTIINNNSQATCGYTCYEVLKSCKDEFITLMSVAIKMIIYINGFLKHVVHKHNNYTVRTRFDINRSEVC